MAVDINFKPRLSNAELGLRINGYTQAIDTQVEWALQQVGLWNGVKNQR